MVSTPAYRKVEPAGSILKAPRKALRSALPMRSHTKKKHFNPPPPPPKVRHQRLRSDPNPSRENNSRNKRADIYLIIIKVLVLDIKLALILRTPGGGGGDTRARVCDIGFIIINRETNKDLMEICPDKCNLFNTCM